MGEKQMAKHPTRRPSASMLVAFVALFAALGGGAFAALSKNSVSSKQIKNASVIGKDLKKDTLTGKQIKESKLGEVPSVLSADAAADAARLAGVEVVRVEPFTLTDGQAKVILEHGAFTLTATCAINDGGDDIATVLIETSVDDAAFDASDSSTDLDVTTSGNQREFIETNDTTGERSFEQETANSAYAPDGSAILGSEAFAALNLGNDPLGTCRFGGDFYVI